MHKQETPLCKLQKILSILLVKIPLISLKIQFFPTFFKLINI